MPKAMDFKNKSKPFEIRSKSPTKAEIVIYGSIGKSWFDDSGISAKKFSEELKALDPAVNEITVRLNSPGGDVFDGITIYNRLKQHKAKIIMMVDGMAASIASVIALAGDEIIIGEGAMFMVHLPMTGMYGNRVEFDNAVQLLMDVEEQMVGIYAKRTGMDRVEIKRLMEAETWLDSAESIEKGFADSKAEESMPIAASAMASPWFKRAPRNYYSEDSVLRDEAIKNSLEIEKRLARK